MRKFCLLNIMDNSTNFNNQDLDIEKQNQQTDEDTENNYKNNGNTKPETQKQSRLSREEIQEFKIAFSMCCEEEGGDHETLHVDKLHELFMTLGYSLAPHNISKLLADFPPDREGILSLDTLLEAYDHWKNDDIEEADLRTVYELITNNEIQTSYKKANDNDRKIDKVTMKVCHDPTISLDDAANVIAEVDSTGFGDIDFEDFKLMMRLG